MENPCRYCQKRFIGCHGSCKDYQDWKEWYEAIKQKQRDEQIIRWRGIEEEKRFKRYMDRIRRQK